MARGFSLVEMLVALSVLSIAGLALMNATRESVRTGSILEDRSLAALAADNILNEQLALASGGTALTADAGSYEIAGRSYGWDLAISRTQDEALDRIVLTLSDAQTGRVLHDVTTFRRRG